MNKVCQSCGMPLNKDPAGGGSERDGSLSHEYCSYCYQRGQLRQPDFSATEMQAFCTEKLREQGVPKPLAWLFTRQIPKLRRWSS